MQIPSELIDRLKVLCEAEGLGMTVIGNVESNVHAIILGDRAYGPNEAAILMVQTLVNGIVADVFRSMSVDALTNANIPPSKPS